MQMGENRMACGRRLRKGEVFAYVGRNQNLQDLQASDRSLIERRGAVDTQLALKVEGEKTLEAHRVALKVPGE